MDNIEKEVRGNQGEQDQENENQGDNNSARIEELG